MHNLTNFIEYTSQSIIDKILLVYSKETGYHFLPYDEWGYYDLEGAQACLARCNALDYVGQKVIE